MARPPDARAAGALGEPPGDLSPAEADCWRRALAAAPAGVLAQIDESVMRLWCYHEARVLEARRMQAILDQTNQLPLLIKTRAGDFVPSPYVGIMNKSTTLMLRMAEILGFCPTARVGLGKAEDGEIPEGEERWAMLAEMRCKVVNG
jgi:phage terminase small subunit